MTKTKQGIAVLFAAALFSAAVQAQTPLEVIPDEAAPAPSSPFEDYSDAPATVDKSWMQYKDPYLEAQQIISNPHRTLEEVSDWAKGMATDLMTHTPDQLEQKIRGYRGSFTDKGYAEYVGYMRDAKILDMVSLRKNDLSTIVNGDVVFVNNGAVNGVYTWTARMPLLISFYQLDANGEHKQVAGGNFRLEMRISRTPPDQNEQGMIIDGWRISR